MAQYATHASLHISSAIGHAPSNTRVLCCPPARKTSRSIAINPSPLTWAGPWRWARDDVIGPTVCPASCNQRRALKWSNSLSLNKHSTPGLSVFVHSFPGIKSGCITLHSTEKPQRLSGVRVVPPPRRPCHGLLSNPEYS